MPYRTYRRKAPAYRAKKRTVYRRKKAYRKRQNKPSTLAFRPKKALGIAFPDTYRTKVVGTLLLSSAAASGVIDYTLRANSILDFGDTKSTDNVSGFDALKTIYNKVIVHGSKCIVQYANSTTTPKYLVLFPYDSEGNSAPTSTRAMMDQPYAKSKLISANTGMGKTTLSQYISIKRMLGLKDLKDVEQCWTFISSTGSQPTRQVSWLFRIDNGTGSGTDADVVKLQVIYYIECFDRNVINQS